MKRVLQILIFILLVTYLVVALGFTSDRLEEIKCSGIKIDIPASDKNNFLDSSDIERILSNNGITVKGKAIREVNTRKIEELFRKNAFVKEVEIFSTVDGILTIRIKQRIPVVRIITSGGSTWYIDNDGYILPASRKFTPFILVANGDFNMGTQLRETMSLGKVSDKKFYKPWNDVLALVRYINSNDFLKAQVVQIYLNSKNEFEMIPRVGAHQIIIGDTSDLESKFEKLELFYREGLRNVGWNKYQKIDLRFKNQVVCSKR